MNRTTVAITWIAIQFCYLGGLAMYEAQRLLPGRGESVLVRTAPVDPRDLLRGQYMRLRYRFSNAPGTLGAEPNDAVWVVLRPTKIGDETFHEPVEYSLTRPGGLSSNDIVIRGSLDGRHRMVFGVEKYFVPFGTETPAASDITVRLRVGDDHRPRIEAVYLKGKPWPAR